MNGKRTVEHVIHWVAAVGPLLFFAVATILGLRAGYDPVAQPISALAVGSHGWIQTLNFALLATSFLCFAVVLKKQFPRGPASVAGPALFVLMTVGVALAGIFTMDGPGAPPTLIGRVHIIAGFLVFPWMPVALFVLARRFRSDTAWRPYFKYTVITGLLCLATIAFFLLFVGTPDSPPRVASGLRGLVQRVQLLPFFAWIALVARRAHRRAHDEFVTAHVSATFEAPV
jgi:hypothetical protein